jgi:hypothetical protein
MDKDVRSLTFDGNMGFQDCAIGNPSVVVLVTTTIVIIVLRFIHEG